MLEIRTTWRRSRSSISVPEHFDTLVAAARVVALGNERADAIARLREAATGDMDPLMRSAVSHGVVAILCRALETHAADVLPQRSRERVGRERQFEGARALAAIAQLEEALDALDRAGIRALPYKGPVLALDAYADAALRSSDDIDLLIDPADVDRAGVVLNALGYHVKDGWSWQRWRAANAWQGQMPLAGAGERFALDLHWRTCDEKLPWNVPLAELQANARELELANRTFAVPDRANHLLLVLLHAARHGWDRLEHLVCAAALLKGLESSDRLNTVVSRPGASHAMVAGLMAIAKLFEGVEGLEPSRAGIGDKSSQLRDLAGVVLARVRAGDAGATRSSRLHLSALDRSIDRARYLALAALQPTPADYSALRLPDALRFTYPLVRIARLLARG
jgi:hypothetical protein